jgi:hypothetical protein
MGDVEWYGPERGRNSVEDVVSHLPGVRAALAGKAMGMAREAAALLAVHHRKGQAYIDVVGAPPRKLDWYIHLRDADPGGKGKAGKNRADRSAMSIEFGWVTKSGKHVEGLHILGNVIRNNRK